jgi:hypothetical protein
MVQIIIVSVIVAFAVFMLAKRFMKGGACCCGSGASGKRDYKCNCQKVCNNDNKK